MCVCTAPVCRNVNVLNVLLIVSRAEKSDEMNAELIDRFGVDRGNVPYFTANMREMCYRGAMLSTEKSRRGFVSVRACPGTVNV